MQLGYNKHLLSSTDDSLNIVTGGHRRLEGWRFTALNYYSSIPRGCLALISPLYHCSCSSYLSAHHFWPHVRAHARDMSGLAEYRFNRSCCRYIWLDFTRWDWRAESGFTDSSPPIRATHTNTCARCVQYFTHTPDTSSSWSMPFAAPRARETAACCHGYLYLKPKGLTSRGMAWG